MGSRNTVLSEDETQITCKQLKKCKTSLVIKELQNQTILYYQGYAN